MSANDHTGSTIFVALGDQTKTEKRHKKRQQYGFRKHEKKIEKNDIPTRSRTLVSTNQAAPAHHGSSVHGEMETKMSA
jgi:hypothetical protein